MSLKGFRKVEKLQYMIIIFKELFRFRSFLLKTCYHFKNTSCDTSISASLTSQTSLHNTKKTQPIHPGRHQQNRDQGKTRKDGHALLSVEKLAMLGKHHGTESFSVANKPMDQLMADFQPKKLRKFLTKKRDAKRKSCKHCKVSNYPPQKNWGECLKHIKKSQR